MTAKTKADRVPSCSECAKQPEHVMQPCLGWLGVTPCKNFQPKKKEKRRGKRK